jgi:hypothetical protein
VRAKPSSIIITKIGKHLIISPNLLFLRQM